MIVSEKPEYPEYEEGDKVVIHGTIVRKCINLNRGPKDSAFTYDVRVAEEWDDEFLSGTLLLATEKE